MIVIGIAGKAGAGKDSLANALHNQLEGSLVVALADPLKSACQVIFDLTEEQTWGRTEKEIPIQPWGLSPRQMFQKIGSAVRDSAGPDAWLRRLEIQIALLEDSGTDYVIVPDIRYDNEAAWVRARGHIIHILRDGIAPVAAHHSEDGITPHLDDYVVQNNGSISDLNDRANAFLNWVWSKTNED